MERKTYYMILGVPSTESDSGIRAAYRELAKRLHPDVAGEQATRSFQEISEAYGVLSDPQRRREYNRELSSAEARAPVSARRSQPDPLVRESVPIFGHRDGTRATIEAMYDRFHRELSAVRAAKPERPECLEFQVLLTAEEASRGCVVPVIVPVLSRCPRCGGSGRAGIFPCAYCQQQGLSEHEASVHVRLPPLTSPRSIYEISLRSLGIHHFFLRLRVAVQAGGWRRSE
jgi:molecular chaperone DnaJ